MGLKKCKINVIAETLRLKSEVGRSPFPSRYIYNQSIDIPRSTNLFCKTMQASAKPCRVSFLFFLFLSLCFCVYTNPNLRSPSNVMILLVGFETVSYSRLDLPYTQIQCQTEDKQTERVRLVVVVVVVVVLSIVIRNHDLRLCCKVKRT